MRVYCTYSAICCTLRHLAAVAKQKCSGLQIYERNEMFRQQVGNLQLIVGVYNNVQATILPVERPLITQKLEAVDSALKKGLQVSTAWLTLAVY